MFSARRPRGKQRPHLETVPVRPIPQCLSTSSTESLRVEDSFNDLAGGEEEEEGEDEDEDDHRAIKTWALGNQPCKWSANVTETTQGRLLIDANGKSYFVNSDKASKVRGMAL